VSNRTSGSAAPWAVTPALPEGTYSWHVRGCDAYICGGYTGWFDFTVDLTPPTGLAIPDSSAYPPKSTGTWSGGIGQPGSFTITATGASRFELTLNGVNKGWVNATGGSWTGDLTPDRDGVNVLSVKAADPAGNVTATAATYQFLVRPAATRSWAWTFDEASGTTAASSPAGYTLTATGTAARTAGHSGTNAVALDGGTRWTTGSPTADTNMPFTVTAWVKLAGTTVAAPITAVSADGPTGSSFRLQYTPGAWCFAMYVYSSGAETKACSTEAVGTGWVHLAGVYDGTRIRLYVNGLNFDDTDVAAFSSGYAANNGWAVGRALVAGVATQMWSGAIDRVAVYQRVLTASEIASDGALS
jgi:hypothetical protein